MAGETAISAIGEKDTMTSSPEPRPSKRLNNLAAAALDTGPRITSRRLRCHGVRQPVLASRTRRVKSARWRPGRSAKGLPAPAVRPTSARLGCEGEPRLTFPRVNLASPAVHCSLGIAKPCHKIEGLRPLVLLRFSW